MMEECTDPSERELLSEKVDLLLEVSFKDIGNAIKKALGKILEAIGKVVEKIKKLIGKLKDKVLKKKIEEFEDIEFDDFEDDDDFDFWNKQEVKEYHDYSVLYFKPTDFIKPGFDPGRAVNTTMDLQKYGIGIKYDKDNIEELYKVLKDFDVMNDETRKNMGNVEFSSDKLRKYIIDYINNKSDKEFKKIESHNDFEEWKKMVIEAYDYEQSKYLMDCLLGYQKISGRLIQECEKMFNIKPSDYIRNNERNISDSEKVFRGYIKMINENVQFLSILCTLETQKMMAAGMAVNKINQMAL